MWVSACSCEDSSSGTSSTVLLMILIHCLSHVISITVFRSPSLVSPENVQWRATKMVSGLGDKSCEKRLKELKLPTLTYRSSQGDIIEAFKLVNDMYSAQSLFM